MCNVTRVPMNDSISLRLPFRTNSTRHVVFSKRKMLDLDQLDFRQTYLAHCCLPQTTSTIIII